MKAQLMPSGLWRVTVMLDENHKIESITQEVEVGGSGADLYRDMKEAGVKYVA